MRIFTFILLTSFLVLLEASVNVFATGYQVGDQSFSDQEAQFSQKIIQLSYPNADPTAGEQRLIRAFKKLQILQNNGRTVTQDDLDQESARIDAGSKNLDKLTKIKNIFGSDHAEYLRIYVMPVYVERVLPFEFFPAETSIQDKRQQFVHQLFQRAQADPYHFTDLASGDQVQIETLAVAKNGIKRVRSLKILADPRASDLKKLDESTVLPSRFWWAHVIPHMKRKGQIFKKVIEAKTGWYIVRYLGRNRKYIHYLKVLHVPKVDYGSWLDSQEQSITVTPIQ